MTARDYFGPGEEMPTAALPQDPEVAGMLRWFDAAHLPKHLAAVSVPIGDLARRLAGELRGGGPELREGLRHLLLAKDALVRAALELNSPPPKP